MSDGATGEREVLLITLATNVLDAHRIEALEEATGGISCQLVDSIEPRYARRRLEPDGVGIGCDGSVRRPVERR